MTEELLVLASTTGTTLVGLMATDAWGTVKGAFVSIWRRNHPELTNIIEGELEATRGELVSTGHGDSPETVEDLANSWRSRVLELLETNPDAVDDLRRFLDGASETESIRRIEIGSIEMRAEASDNGRNFQLGQGTQNIG
ncbi:hypothetical protein OG250_23205 [Streptomyces sp. NBC_00487]|uniref:hypothetical protein n=1 Tax=unclassified Streptomyces TaxID=2593676 RepID=UPI002E19EF85|nr:MULTISPECIES: hypothetical protein [unclassified Streptomyces]